MKKVVAFPSLPIRPVRPEGVLNSWLRNDLEVLTNSMDITLNTLRKVIVDHLSHSLEVITFSDEVNILHYGLLVSFRQYDTQHTDKIPYIFR